MSASGDNNQTPNTTTTVTPTTVSTPSTKSKKYQQNYRLKKHLTRKLITLLSTASSTSLSFLHQNDLLLLPSQTLSLESLISSTSISLSTLLSLLSSKPLQRTSISSPPQQCWFHRFLSTASDYDRRWVLSFRMSKPSFTLLLRLLSPSLEGLVSPIPPNYALAASLYRLAHNAPYKATGRRFGLDSVQVCRAFFSVCKLITEKLGDLFELRSDIGRIIRGFGWISLPNCCGVLGLGRFEIEGELLGINGSVMVQALVDSEGRFLDVSAGWPSTMKPEMILRQSKLFSGVEESRELLNGPSCELSDGNFISQYMLGDSYFPLLPWLLTPYISTSQEDSFSSSELEFNLACSRGMKLVNTTFGRLRAQWQLLGRPWKEECIEYLPFVIVAGCLLHNFLIKCNEPMADEKADCFREDKFSTFEGEVNESGQSIRDALASYLNGVSLGR